MPEAALHIRLHHIPPLSSGAHENLASGACLMEAVSYVVGEPWSDHPQCVCPVIAAFCRNWNDNLPDDERDVFMRPLIPLLVNTRGSAKLERFRASMAADWLIRVHTPAWLRLAKLDAAAEGLESLPEITDFAQCPSLMPALKAASRDANVAWDAAWAAARAARSGASHDRRDGCSLTCPPPF